MIRRATGKESGILTEISFRSKKYWQYPDEYYEIWREELTISARYVSENEVYVYQYNENISGYYSLVELPESLNINGVILAAGLWLDHMFLLPDAIGKGIGRKLFHHALTVCSEKRYKVLRILADPNASAFYLKMGCRYMKEFPSTIPGRTTPYLEYKLSGK